MFPQSLNSLRNLLRGTHAYAMDDPDKQKDCGRHEWDTNEGVRDTAMMGELEQRALEVSDDVDVGRLGCEGHGQRCQGGLAIETGAAQCCAGQKVRDRFQILVASFSSFVTAA